MRSTKENEELTDPDAKNKNKEGDIQAWLKQLIRRDQKTLDTIDIEYNESEDETLFDTFPFTIGGKPKRSMIWDQEMSPVVASLSSMVNVEALMAAANVTAANITSNIELDQDLQPPSPDFQSDLSRTDTIADALSFLDGSTLDVRSGTGGVCEIKLWRARRRSFQETIEHGGSHLWNHVAEFPGVTGRLRRRRGLDFVLRLCHVHGEPFRAARNRPLLASLLQQYGVRLFSSSSKFLRIR